MFAGQGCGGKGGSSFRGGFFLADLNGFNVLLGEDWGYYFGRVGAGRVIVGEGAWRDWEEEEWAAAAHENT